MTTTQTGTLRGPALWAEPRKVLNGARPAAVQIRTDPRTRTRRKKPPAATTWEKYEIKWSLLQRRNPDVRFAEFTEDHLVDFFTFGVETETYYETIAKVACRRTRFVTDEAGALVRFRRVVGQPGWTESNVNSYISAFKFVFRWGVKAGLVPEDPTARLDDLFGCEARTYREAVWLDETQTEALTTLDPAMAEDPLALRDIVICHTLVGAGLREDELCQARWPGGSPAEGLDTIVYLDKTQPEIRVNRGKGGKSRIVFPTTKTVEALRLWRSVSEAATGDVAGKPLFPMGQPIARPGTRGAMFVRVEWHKPLGVKGVTAIVTKAGGRIGEPGLRPHDLRRTFAGLLQNHGARIEDICEQLGHENITTTQLYLQDNPARRAQVMAGAGW